MKNQPPLKQIVQETRPIWDRDDTPEHVRKNLRKVLACKTSELGAEVYQSESEKKVVYHTCKSRSCPSCGHTTTRQWQRERWAALPDIPFATMVFTMPHFLWPIFRHNRHLLHDLPTLAAAVLQTWARSSRGTRLFITVIPHTFGARLNFHPHLHILVSAGGLQEADGSWVDRVPFNKQEIMCLWRHAVTLYLLKAVKSGIVSSSRSTPEMNDLLVTQYRRWWNIHIDRRASKTHFLRYVGRYVRRPPIAQRNLISVSDGKVQFRVKDRKTQQKIIGRHSYVAFIQALADHIPERYRHGIRHFGLLAPNANRQLMGSVFALLDQRQRSRPRRVSWAYSLRTTFHVDPLRDSQGHEMRWAGRLSST